MIQVLPNTFCQRMSQKMDRLPLAFSAPAGRRQIQAHVPLRTLEKSVGVADLLTLQPKSVPQCTGPGYANSGAERVAGHQHIPHCWVAGLHFQAVELLVCFPCRPPTQGESMRSVDSGGRRAVAGSKVTN